MPSKKPTKTKAARRTTATRPKTAAGGKSSSKTTVKRAAATKIAVKSVKKVSVRPKPAANLVKPGSRPASSANKTTSASSKTSAKQKPAKRTVAKKPLAKSKSAKVADSKKVALGRPRVTAEAKLDDIFRKDYQARELFEFLGVRTVRELEAFRPDEIVERLTAPVVQTVGRIRKALAMLNRCLAGDAAFASDFKRLLQGSDAVPRKTA